MVLPSHKYCAHCKETLPAVLFPKNRSTKDGLHAYCLACNREKQAAERARRGDDYREMRRRYRATEGGRAAYRRYRVGHPGKLYAHNAVQHAVANGTMTRPTECQQCGKGGKGGMIDSHHDDYAKVLEVRWLCRWCHQEWHRANGEAPNADKVYNPNAGLRLRREVAKAARLAKVAELVANGTPRELVASMFGVTISTIHDDLKRQGMTRRYSVCG